MWLRSGAWRHRLAVTPSVNGRWFDYDTDEGKQPIDEAAAASVWTYRTLIIRGPRTLAVDLERATGRWLTLQNWCQRAPRWAAKLAAAEVVPRDGRATLVVGVP